MYNIIFSSIAIREKIIIFLTFSFSVMLALTVHEFSHAFVAYKLGDKTAKVNGRMSLNPMVHFDIMGLFSFILFGFGWAKPVPINPYNFRNIKKGTFLVSLSGIISNLILAFVFYPIAVLFLRAYLSSASIILEFLYYLFYFLFQANLVLMVFNLLPIYPLDGFNALASQLSYNNSYVKFNYRYGPYILIGLAIIISVTHIFSNVVDIIGYPISAFWGLFL